MEVAVIGGGAGGLISAHELLREGHSPTIFEAGDRIGGTWVLQDADQDDPLGKKHGRVNVHSSMYETLRTNIPREVMGHPELPFMPEFMGGRSVDARRYPGHEEVLQYLLALADAFDLHRLVRLRNRVTQVVPSVTHGSDAPPPWTVTSEYSASSQHDAGDASTLSRTETFDAIVVCNGHFTAPRVPDIPGLDTFAGRCEHSHNYRRPSDYSGKRVVVIGASASGNDIGRDISLSAAEVYMSAASWMKDEWELERGPFGRQGNMFRRPWVKELQSDGTVVFTDGSSIGNVDVVLFCTGYSYTTDFLDASIVKASSSHVQHLYKHIFPPAHDGRLAFVGVPFLCVPLFVATIQARLVARILSGKATLPSTADMQASIARIYSFLADTKQPLRRVHKLGHYQWPYLDELASLANVEAPPAWRRQLWMDTFAHLAKYGPDEYREHWDNKASMDAAHATFAMLRGGGEAAEDEQ